MTGTNLTDGGDDVAGVLGLTGADLEALAAEGLAGLEAPPPTPAPTHTTLTAHAGAVVYQARMLTVADLFDCGPGVAGAVEDLALALDRSAPGQLKGAALDLVDVTRATADHRKALDARPPARAALDGPGEMYPRDVFTVPPRYSHADRRSATIGSIELMAEFLATTTHPDTI